VVRLSGRDHYTGPWGKTDAEAAHERHVADWPANARTLSSGIAARPAILRLRGQSDPIANRHAEMIGGTGPGRLPGKSHDEGAAAGH
jgi:hypothetical protein